MIKSFRHKGLQRFFETGSKSGIQATHAAKLPPLFGREEEIELLLRRWRAGAEGATAVVEPADAPPFAVLLSPGPCAPEARHRRKCASSHGTRYPSDAVASPDAANVITPPRVRRARSWRRA